MKKDDLTDFIFIGVPDELPVPGPVGVCASVPTTAPAGLQHLGGVGLRHGGLQDVLPAQSDQTCGLLLQLHRCEFTSRQFSSSFRSFRPSLVHFLGFQLGTDQNPIL